VELDLNNKAAISFKDVYFSYKNRSDAFVLKGLNLEINPGEKIALTSFSGEGKSTIFNLLLRLYPYESGEILLADTKVESIEISCLRKIFSYAAQNSIILSTTIRENLTFGNNDITKEQLEEVTKGVGIYEFIDALPEGFDSRVNEKGVNLSGGQKQRLALARALLFAQNKEIILLDESTSSVDPETEVEIYQNIFKHFKGKTFIASIHKMNLLKYFDTIVMFDKGTVVDQGSFEELLARNSDFKSMWESYIKTNS
jgi:ABC-type multidrug transport system fused ATPase/permease subunit